MPLLLALSACVSFRGGELGDAPVLEPRADPPSVAVVVTAYDVFPERRDIPALPAWTEWVMDGYTESGLFREVRSGFGDADLHVEVTLERRDESNLALATLSGLTLTVFPAWGSAELTMISRFRDGQGNELVTTRKKESVHIWIQLLLIFALPFGYPPVVSANVMQDLVLHSLAEAAPHFERAPDAGTVAGR